MAESFNASILPFSKLKTKSFLKFLKEFNDIYIVRLENDFSALRQIS
jgi:hypothetical protein